MNGNAVTVTATSNMPSTSDLTVDRQSARRARSDMMLRCGESPS